jgi:hypothetical protein
MSTTMKLFVAFILALAGAFAHADTAVINGQHVTTGVTSLYSGAGTGSALATGCAPLPKKVTKASPYTCKTPLVVAPLAVQPKDKTQTAQCGAGFAGSWSQRQTAIYDVSTNTWSFTGAAWLPEKPPAGVCVPIIVKPPQPADQTQQAACPAGYTGTFPQTKTTTYDAATNSWVWGEWLPKTAPLGLCTVIVSNPPPTTGYLPYVNPASFPPSFAGWSRPLIRAVSSTQLPTKSDEGSFREPVLFSHFNFDDPIIYPGIKGASHGHAQFGFGFTDAFTVSSNLQGCLSSTNGGGTLNCSAYWVPLMVDTTDGSAVVPASMLVYYKTGYGGVDTRKIQPVPRDLRFISGNPAAKTEAEAKVGRFVCYGDPGVGWQKTIPSNCQAGNLMVMEVHFPQCWDGKNLDSPDHRGHMAEAEGGCPATHPVPLPAISYEIYYQVTAANVGRMKNWRLSSDNYPTTMPGGLSAHGDYWMGWDEATMKQIVVGCLNASMDCHAGPLNNGQELYIP